MSTAGRLDRFTGKARDLTTCDSLSGEEVEILLVLDPLDSLAELAIDEQACALRCGKASARLPRGCQEESPCHCGLSVEWAHRRAAVPIRERRAATARLSAGVVGRLRIGIPL